MKKSKLFLFFVAFLTLFTVYSNAQVISFSTHPTPYINNNGQNGITFAIQNTNGFPAILTSLSNYYTTGGSSTVELWSSTTNLGGSPGVISTATGWTLEATNTVTITGASMNVLFPTLNVNIAGGTTKRFHINSSVGLQYNCTGSTACNTINSFTQNGVNLLCGDYTIGGGWVGWGGPASGPTFNPRYFTGEMTLNLLSTPCTGIPNVDSAIVSSLNPCAGSAVTLNLTGINQSGLGYQWQRSTSATGPWLPLPGANTQNYNYVPPAGNCFYFRCQVTCNVSGGIAYSTVVGPVCAQAFDPCSLCFCPSTATSATGSDITNFTMGAINNTTDCATPLNGSQGTGTGTANQYSNFTCTSVPTQVLLKGAPQSFSSIHSSCNTTNYSSGMKIYIDYNHNSTFDANEEVYFSGTTAFTTNPPSTVTGSVTVPPTALDGLTRMRVITQSGGAATATTIQPCATYTTGETEDYTVNIITPGPTDPAVFSITPPTGNCYSTCDTVSALITNYGSQNINGLTNPITVTLHVTGPNGVQTYTTNVPPSTLLAYGGNTVSVTFPCVDLYAGGTYSLNTSLTISGAGNAYAWNDSLVTPITLLNYRPTPGPNYILCQYDVIPFGQGLTATGCATPINDSIVIPFTINPQLSSTNPSSNNIYGSLLFATGIVPTLSLPTTGVTVTGAIQQVTNLSTTAGGWANEARFPIFSGIIPPVNAGNILYSSAVGNPATSSSNYTWTNLPSLNSTNSLLNLTNLWNYIINPLNAGNTLSMGYHSTWSGNASSKGFNINAGSNTTTAVLKIYYTYVPSNFEWYAVPTGGTVLSTSVPFNPVGVPGSGVPNSNTTGTYPFYVSCQGSSDCRVEVDLIIPAAPITIQDTLTLCEFPSGSNGAVFNVTTKIPYVGPQSVIDTNVQVTFYQDQALFSPVTPDTAYLTSSNFVYTKVQDTLNGCFTSDSLYLSVFSTPDFGSAFLNGNACAPSYIDVASLITVPLPTGSDTLYYEDPLFMTPHPNPHNITTVDTVYIVVETNTTPACGDTATAIINILPQSNYISNQVVPFNYSDCSSIPLGVFSLTDGLSDTLRTTTDCRKIVAVTDEPDGTDLGSITAQVDIACSTPVYQGQPYVNRVYQITPTNNDSATVCLYYLDEDFNSFSADAFVMGWDVMIPTSNLCITKVHNGPAGNPGSTFTVIPNSAMNISYDPSTTVWQVCFPVSDFSYFYCHTCNPVNAALPITLVKFEGKRVGDVSELTWSTSHEQNNSHFIVERSKDGNNFISISDKIATQAIGGNSNSILQYGYTDASPMQGHNYYRLRQVDIDGRESESKVVDVYYGNDVMVSLYPNPVSNMLYVDVNTPKAAKATMRILDATGRVVLEEAIELGVGNSKASMNMSSLSDGMYMFVISNDKDINYTQTIRKQ